MLLVHRWLIDVQGVSMSGCPGRSCRGLHRGFAGAVLCERCDGHPDAGRAILCVGVVFPAFVSSWFHPPHPLEKMHCSISIPSPQYLLGYLPASGRVESSGCPGSCLAHGEELPALCWALGPFPEHSKPVASGCPSLQGCPSSVGSNALQGAVGMCRCQ